MRKSFVALTLAAVMAIAAVPAFADDTAVTTTAASVSANSVSANKFTDVESTKWFAGDVAWAVENGVAYGTSNTTFAPYKTCQRDEIVAFLYRTEKEPAVSANSVFTDVAKKNWAYNAVTWGAAEGVVAGTSKTTFSPKAVCTRAQAVTFIWRLAKRPAATKTSVFTDTASLKVADYKAAINWASENGVTAGKTATEFAPSDTCTRAEIVSFIHRAVEKGLISSTVSGNNL
ncbi:MAG: S-layer homology domain-containing protein [Lachnospiraceae bacterium]|nr:S-layer homology domain-containing protein [Lachnospiraceae bacterium]